MNRRTYVPDSLALHLFFGRIMKEHALFLEAGFTPKDSSFANRADRFKTEFEKLLQNAIRLSDGVVNPGVLASGEVVTDFTLGTETQTENLTGIHIDQNLTIQETKLQGGMDYGLSQSRTTAVHSLNAGAIELLDNFINFKTSILNSVLSCNMFTANYPLLIDHILREAKMYRDHLITLEGGRWLDRDPKQTELFWDQIMMEHALFIRGLLDPSEGVLVNSANDFAAEFSDLIQKAKTANDRVIKDLTTETLADTKKLRDFKTAGAKGIAECKIRSIILPLLADHVLREANHYIRLLEQM